MCTTWMWDIAMVVMPFIRDEYEGAVLRERQSRLRIAGSGARAAPSVAEGLQRAVESG